MFNCSNNNIIILIFVLIFCFIFYIISELNNLKKSLTNKVENFTTQDDINTAVKKIYLADVESIRLLSNFAIQLSQGGFTIPGNVNINGELRTNNMIVTPHDHVIMCNGTQQIRSENDLYLLPRGNVILGNNGGGSGNLIYQTKDSFIGGGGGNRNSEASSGSVIGGGILNCNRYGSTLSTIGGGFQNYHYGATFSFIISIF